VNRIAITGPNETKRRIRELIPEKTRARILDRAIALGRLGYELHARSDESLTYEKRRRARLLRSRGITQVLDVGARGDRVLPLTGFRLAGLEEGHDDIRTGEMHADGIFVRDD
jgi:hypothetical protein